MIIKIDDLSIYQAVIQWWEGPHYGPPPANMTRLEGVGRVGLFGPVPKSFEELVELTMEGRFDRREEDGTIRTAVVAVHYWNELLEERQVYTGLLRRVREGKLSPEDYVRYVKRTREIGDLIHWETDGLPERVRRAASLARARDWAAVSHRLFGEHGNLEALDRRALEKFDREWEELAATL